MTSFIPFQIRSRFGFVLEFFDQLGDTEPTVTPALRRFRRLGNLQHLQARPGHVNAVGPPETSSSSGFFLAFMMLGREA